VHSRLDRPIAAFVELAHRRLDLDHRLLHGGQAQQLVAPTMGRRIPGRTGYSMAPAKEHTQTRHEIGRTRVRDRAR
jgi:hypothetical protein